MNISGKIDLSVTLTGSAHVYQFVGLLWATEYNAQQAQIQNGVNAQTVNAMNTLLMAYAASEALVLETALALHPMLYRDKRGFRMAGLVSQYESFLKSDGRATEKVPPEIEELADRRVALTHSEPDNVRSSSLGEVISGTDAVRFATQLRQRAEWLWQGKRPTAVADAFDQPNCFLS